MASNLVENKLSKIISEMEKDHLLKRPGDREIIQGVAGGFYLAIRNFKKAKEGK